MNYTLIKSTDFCGTPCDIYSDDNNEMFMTAFQLGSCLEYANPQKAIDNLISRNEYLKADEFSVTLKMRATDSKQYDTRIFTEDGIYEVTMLAKTEKAKEFRAFVRKLIKSIRKGETVVIDSKVFTELLQRQSELEKRLEALENNKKLLVQDMQNPVHNFIKECCIMRVSYRDGITTSKLYRAFEMWCRYNTPYAPSKSDFIAGILSYYNTNNKKRIKKKCNGYYYYIITLNPRSIRKLL